MNLEYPRLRYRGHFDLKRRKDYSRVNLSAEYPNGYREDIIIGVPLMSWSLSYPSLSDRAYIALENGDRKTRREYIEDFVDASILNGNAPFVIEDPLNGKDYLAIFAQDTLELSVTFTQFLLSSANLEIKQVNVKGVNTLADGSLGLNDNPAQI